MIDLITDDNGVRLDDGSPRTKDIVGVFVVKRASCPPAAVPARDDEPLFEAEALDDGRVVVRKRESNPQEKGVLVERIDGSLTVYTELDAQEVLLEWWGRQNQVEMKRWREQCRARHGGGQVAADE
jgi:hypothetical protein